LCHLGNHEQLLDGYGAGELLTNNGQVAVAKHLQLGQYLRNFRSRLDTRVRTAEQIITLTLQKKRKKGGHLDIGHMNHSVEHVHELHRFKHILKR
jgi:hypothetical protein